MKEWGFKRCPFCGGINISAGHDGDGTFYVSCNGCDCYSTGETMDEAFQKWQTRVGTDEIKQAERRGAERMMYSVPGLTREFFKTWHYDKSFHEYMTECIMDLPLSDNEGVES